MDELLQEKHRGDPWKVFVSCILLNQTGRVLVDRVIDELLHEYPVPEFLANARLRDVRDIVESNGLGWIKAARLIHMSDDYLRWDGQAGTVADIHGVGPYALDSYNIFCRGLREVASGDKELLAYLGRES